MTITTSSFLQQRSRVTGMCLSSLTGSRYTVVRGSGLCSIDILLKAPLTSTLRKISQPSSASSSSSSSPSSPPVMFMLVTKESCKVSRWSARVNILHADPITTADASTPPPAFALTCWRPLCQRSFENNRAQQCGTPLLDCPQSLALAVVHVYSIVEVTGGKDELGAGTPFCDVKKRSPTGS